jgi:hypothetical protein
MTEYLFVGGPFHGELREVSRPDHEVHYNQPITDLLAETVVRAIAPSPPRRSYVLQEVGLFGVPVPLYVESQLKGEVRDDVLASVVLSAAARDQRTSVRTAKVTS